MPSMLTSDCPTSRAMSALAMIPPAWPMISPFCVCLGVRRLSALAAGCLRRAGPLRDAGLAGPEPQPGAARDETGGGVLVQANEAVVGQAAEPGGLEQRRGVAHVADELAVGVGVGHEVTHRGLGGQRGRAVLGSEQDHGVVEHGRAAVDLLVGRRMIAVTVVDAADRGGDELDVDLRLLSR